MRSLLIVLAGACASLSISLIVGIVLVSEERLYYEVLDDGLLQTTASENQVNLAVAAVLEAKRAPAPTLEQQMEDADYREEAAAWFAKPNLFGQTTERASRFERMQIDRDGKQTRIEVLRGADMPTLVFVHNQDEVKRDSIAQWLGSELAHLGVAER